ncbi:MAG TPA: MBL fold metallo-hydrolase [Spirochaetia bacterium]|nr:MBL fold metallo-hydrolase [Spirochaetia bacterium]
MGKDVTDLTRWAREHLTWFGQSAFRIRGSQTVVFLDPFRVPPSAGPADLILVTHPHTDHYDKKAIGGLRRESTLVVLPASCAQPGERGLAAGQTETFAGVKVIGVPAYNATKRFHPASGSWLGYVIEIDGMKLYHAGDTDPVPEMSGLHPDIALLPVGGMFTMNWRLAVEAAGTIGATLAIPMHFNMLIGGRKAGERFASALGAAGLVLPRG